MYVVHHVSGAGITVIWSVLSRVSARRRMTESTKSRCLQEGVYDLDFANVLQTNKRVSLMAFRLLTQNCSKYLWICRDSLETVFLFTVIAGGSGGLGPHGGPAAGAPMGGMQGPPGGPPGMPSIVIPRDGSAPYFSAYVACSETYWYIRELRISSWDMYSHSRAFEVMAINFWFS